MPRSRWMLVAARPFYPAPPPQLHNDIQCNYSKLQTLFSRRPAFAQGYGAGTPPSSRLWRGKHTPVRSFRPTGRARQAFCWADPS